MKNVSEVTDVDGKKTEYRGTKTISKKSEESPMDEIVKGRIS